MSGTRPRNFFAVGERFQAIDRLARRRAQGVGDFDRVAGEMGTAGWRRDRDDWRQRRAKGLRRDRAIGGLVRPANRLGFVTRLEHEPHDVGTVVFGAELRGGEEIGLLRPAAVDVPADQVLAAGRGHVIARWRPGDPFAALRLDEQGEQLRAVAPAQPADRAVAVCDREDCAVGGKIDATCDAWTSPAPALLALCVIGADRKLGSEGEAGGVGPDREGAGTFRNLSNASFAPLNFGAVLSSQSVTGRPSIFALRNFGGRVVESVREAAAILKRTDFSSPYPMPNLTDVASGESANADPSLSRMSAERGP